MSNNRKYLILLVVVACTLFVLGSHLYSQQYHQDVKKHKKMFVYNDMLSVPQAALIIENREMYGKKLVEFYRNMETRPDGPFRVHVPIKELPTNYPVYVMNYSEDSLLVDVVSYYDRGPYMGGSYLRGWVYIGTLHDAPPGGVNSL